MLHARALIEIKDTRHLLAKVLLFVPVLFMVLAVNVLIDPGEIFRTMADKHRTYEYKVAQALAAGKNVTLVRPVDDRLLQKYFVENMSVAPDIVVLGSSDSVWLGDNVFPDKKVINNSVSDAVLADYLGIFEGYAKKNMYPQRVILFLNPQLIVPSLISPRWLSVKEDTYAMLDRMGVHSDTIKEPLIPQAWRYIFSFSYFQRSMEELRENFTQQDHPGNKDIAGGQSAFLKDGRCLMEFDSGDAADSRRKTIKNIYHGQLAQALRSGIRPDKELEGILEKFIRYLTGHHIQVTLCLTPCHPERYQSLLELRKRPGALDIIGMEQYYRGLARRLDVKIAGSYDPAACHLGGQDFYDGEHIKNDVIEKMFKEEL